MTQGRVIPTVSHSWKASTTDRVGWHLTGQDHHRDGVHVGRGDTGDGVGHARAAGHQTHAGLLQWIGSSASAACTAACSWRTRMCCTFSCLKQRVVDVQDGSTRVAEDVLDALFLKTAHDDFCACEFH